MKMPNPTSTPHSVFFTTAKSLMVDKAYLNVVAGHFVVDFLSGQRYVLLTYFAVILGLSNSDLGFVSMLYMLLASLLQPAFGYLADRFGRLPFVVGGLAWLGAFYALAMVMGESAGLALFIVAGIGSAAFHPAATVLSTRASLSRASTHETMTTAIFFLFGQTGHFLGPLIAGVILTETGLVGLSGLSLIALPLTLTSINLMKQSRPTEKNALEPARPVQSPTRVTAGPTRTALLAFATVAALQSWSQQNMITFVPKYISDLGQSPASYGFLASLFMAGSALGNLIGGALADQFGKKRIIVLMLALSIVPVVLVKPAGWSLWLYLLIPLAGALTGATFSVIIVLAQQLLPVGQALASGLILGFVFSSGAVGTFFSGYAADIWGVPSVFYMTGGLLLIAAVCGLFIGSADRSEPREPNAGDVRRDRY